jgi:hypothetical protein
MNEIEKRQFEADLAQRGLELGEHVYHARIIQASAADIWKAVSQPGQLDKYHAYVRENAPVYKWPGVGSRDGITYYSGLYMERDFMYWREGEGYDLQTGPPPRKSSWTSWNIRPLGENQSELSIMITPILESHLLETTKKIFVRTYFGKSIEVYLDSFLRGIEQFAMTGKKVQPRQFGTHPVYAP